jgi:hypothetical protein
VKKTVRKKQNKINVHPDSKSRKNVFQLLRRAIFSSEPIIIGDLNPPRQVA